MHTAHLVALFFGGLFLANTLPHLSAGVMGRAFQTPFAKPSGIGLSSSTVNVLWGWANAVIAYLLLIPVGKLDLRTPLSVVTVAVGVLLMSLFAARHFGQFHGGNTAEQA